MFNILSQPYPHAQSARKNITLAIGTGLFVALFLTYFQPFGSNNWQDPNKLWLLSGFGLVTTTLMLLNSFLVPKALPNAFVEQSWTMLKEITFVAYHILSIAIGNVLYAQLTGLMDPQIRGAFSMIIYTFTLGIIPTIVIILINYIYHLKLYAIEKHNIPSNTIKLSEHNLLITLTSENEKDHISFLEQDLCYIESSDNYCTVYFLKENKLYKEILRSSLSRLESILPQNTNYVRCHRSFVVNLGKIEAVSGNAQGYKFHLYNQSLTVPVSRKYASIVEPFK